MRKLMLTTLVLAVMGGGVIAEAQAEADRITYGERISSKISKHIRGTHFCQMKMDRPRTKVRLLFTKQSIQRRKYVLRVWIERHDDTCDAYRKQRKQRSYGNLGGLNCLACWYRVASCESGQRWNYNGGSGFDGGLQFLPSTWLGYGGGRYAPYAYMATAMQQISIASHMALSHWPVCGARY